MLTANKQNILEKEAKNLLNRKVCREKSINLSSRLQYIGQALFHLVSIVHTKNPFSSSSSSVSTRGGGGDEGTLCVAFSSSVQLLSVAIIVLIQPGLQG